MDRFARLVLGYHGCIEPLATQLLSGEVAIESWPRSENRWDWLGAGTYFWEHGPERALRWAQEKARRVGGEAKPAVVGAVIQLSGCLDLTEIANTELLAEAHAAVVDLYREEGKALPENRGPDDDRKMRELDCVVINFCRTRLRGVGGAPFMSVRGAFMEGPPAFPGSMVCKESHIQIVVRDPACILGLFRPNLMVGAAP